MRDAVLTATDGWNLLERLCQDQRVEFLLEPPGIEVIIPSLFRYPVPTPQLVGDAYLAAFAIASNRTLVTLDAGFRQYRGLDVSLLTD